MKLYFKNMVSQRCINLVKSELEALGIDHFMVGLGFAEVNDQISQRQKDLLKKNISNNGLELIENRKRILIEGVKNLIIDLIQNETDFPEIKFSSYISNHLHRDYGYLSNIFSEEEGRSIQQFMILHRIEKVKELLSYDDFNLTEISYKLHYSSVAHLSYQFKKITGISPRLYKKQCMVRTKPIDQI